MTIPIYENGAPAGSLQITRQGLYTLFEARLPAAPALSRLWLLGERGAAAPMGLLRPGPESRILRRRLTRLDCRALPSRPVRALVLPADAPAPMSPAEQCSALRECPVPAVGTTIGRPPTDAPVPAVGADALVGPQTGLDNRPRAVQGPAPTAPATPNSAFRIPHSVSPWQPRPDGSLIDPARRLLALPWSGGQLPAPARKITLNGREYWLFRY